MRGCSLDDDWSGGSGSFPLLVNPSGRGAGASQFGNEEGQGQHAQFNFRSPTPAVSAACTVIPIPKAALNVWNRRQACGGMG